jgi:hypothetical protein
MDRDIPKHDLKRPTSLFHDIRRLFMDTQVALNCRVYASVSNGTSSGAVASVSLSQRSPRQWHNSCHLDFFCNPKSGPIRHKSKGENVLTCRPFQVLFVWPSSTETAVTSKGCQVPVMKVGIQRLKSTLVATLLKRITSSKSPSSPFMLEKRMHEHSVLVSFYSHMSPQCQWYYRLTGMFCNYKHTWQIRGSDSGWLRSLWVTTRYNQICCLLRLV